MASGKPLPPVVTGLPAPYGTGVGGSGDGRVIQSTWAAGRLSLPCSLARVLDVRTAQTLAPHPRSTIPPPLRR